MPSDQAFNIGVKENHNLFFKGNSITRSAQTLKGLKKPYISQKPFDNTLSPSKPFRFLKYIINIIWFYFLFQSHIILKICHKMIAMHCQPLVAFKEY